MKRQLVLFFLSILPLLDAHVVFVHIPKTGGMTLHHLLQAHYPPSQIYPFRNFGGPPGGGQKASTPRQVKSVLTKYPSINHQLVSGHIPVWFHKKKNPFFDTSFVFTILREPVERVLSHHRYNNRKRKEWGKPLTSDPLTIPANYMCLMLSSDPTLKGDALLNSALQNLQKMDAILFFDDYEGGGDPPFQPIGPSPSRNNSHHQCSPLERERRSNRSRIARQDQRAKCARYSPL